MTADFLLFQGVGNFKIRCSTLFKVKDWLKSLLYTVSDSKGTPSIEKGIPFYVLAVRILHLCSKLR